MKTNKAILLSIILMAIIFTQVSMNMLSTRAESDTIIVRNSDYLNLVEKSEKAHRENPKLPAFHYDGLEKFAKDLKEEYLPILLNNLEENFTSMKSMHDGLGIGLHLYYEPYSSKLAYAWVDTKGTKYALGVNMSHLTSTPDGYVDMDRERGNITEYIQHELMHIVMFDITSSGMAIQDNIYPYAIHPPRIYQVDRFPKWFYEGMAVSVQGGINKFNSPPMNQMASDLLKPNPTMESKQKMKDWLEKFDKNFVYTGPEYKQGYIAVMYLGHIISGDNQISAKGILRGLDELLHFLSEGFSLSESIYRLTKEKSVEYHSLEDFVNRFPEDGIYFSANFLKIARSCLEKNRNASGSILSPDGFMGTSESLLYENAKNSNTYTLHTAENNPYDNTEFLKSKPVFTGGGSTKSMRLRKDGSLNTEAFEKWDSSSIEKHGSTLTYKTEYYLYDEELSEFILHKTTEHSGVYHSYIQAEVLDFTGYEFDSFCPRTILEKSLDQNGIILRVFYQKKMREAISKESKKTIYSLVSSS